MNRPVSPESHPRNRGSLEQRIRKLARRYGAHQHKPDHPASPRRWRAPWVGTIGLGVLVQLAASQVPASTFDTANENYAAGHYSEAAKGFEQVIAERGYSAPVLFDLGNAWLKAGQPGRAILNYERARRLSPDDAAVQINLNLARQKAGVAANENQFREQVARVLSLDPLAWTLVWSMAIFCAVVLASRLLPVFPRWLSRSLAAIAMLAVVVAGAGIVLQWPERDRAVVVAADAEAQIAPAAAAGVVFKLPAGEIVRARQSHHGYTLVHLRDGRSGWVKAAAVERVI